MNLFGNSTTKYNICVCVRDALKIQTLLIMYKSNKIFLKGGIAFNVLSFDLIKIILPASSVFKTFFYLWQGRRLDPSRRITNGLVNGLLLEIIFNFKNGKKWVKVKFVKYDGCSFFFFGICFDVKTLF